MIEGGWERRGSALWVRPPGGQSVRLCAMTRVWRMDPGGPTVVGVITVGARRWVLYSGRWAEVSPA